MTTETRPTDWCGWCAAGGTLPGWPTTAAPPCKWLRTNTPMSCCWTLKCRSWTGARSPNNCDSISPSKECFIIAVTGGTDERGRRQCAEAGIDLVLIKPVDSSVVETLLMLECERVNRSPTDDPVRLADQAAEIIKLALALEPHNNRRQRHEKGGSSCWSYRGKLRNP